MWLRWGKQRICGSHSLANQRGLRQHQRPFVRWVFSPLLSKAYNDMWQQWTSIVGQLNCFPWGPARVYIRGICSVRWQGSAAYTKDRPVHSSERAPHEYKTVTVKSNKYMVMSSRWGSTPRLTDWQIISRIVTLTWNIRREDSTEAGEITSSEALLSNENANICSTTQELLSVCLRASASACISLLRTSERLNWSQWNLVSISCHVRPFQTAYFINLHSPWLLPALQPLKLTHSWSWALLEKPPIV
jgi:hypothetical protein